jgi:hypothetical protein
MEKFSQNSIVDFLVNLMPELARIKNEFVNHTIADKLYAIWQNPENKVGNRVYKIPKTISAKDIEEMQKVGLVSKIGDTVQITSKGSNIVKTIILGNDKSALDKEGESRNYVTASKYVKLPSKLTRKNSSKFAQNWWKKFEENNS